jgi:acyl-CoA synthetase (AMP-forming)/AMP-acid ligase II
MLNTNITMGEAFREVAERYPKRLALVCADARYTYAELLARVHKMASKLYDLGVKKGDRVAVYLSPGVDYATLFFATADVGGVFVPLNTALRSLSINNVVNDANPVVMVADAHIDDSSFIRPDALKHLITTDGPGTTNVLDELIGDYPPDVYPTVDVLPDDLMSLLYTSGTTGTPKGTMHTHRSLITPVVASLKIRELWLRKPNLKTLGDTAKALARYKTRLIRVAGRPQVFLSTVGWNTTTGIELMEQALLMGDELVAMLHFHPRQAMELIEREKVTILVAIPTAYYAIFSLEDFDRFKTSSLLICGTGAMPTPPELGRKIQERFHCALHIGFGATEMAGGIAIPSIGDSAEIQATTVGKPLPGMQVKVVDEDRNELPAGQVGELLVKGESIMKGYFGRPEATSDVIDKEGWYASGDLALIDSNGYLQIKGRKKDMIIRSGQNIYPIEVEDYLITHPDIREAAVVGVPSELSGEEVWAFVIPKLGVELTARQVLDYCRKDLEAFKIPSQVRIVEDLPRTELGKVQKYRLQSEIMAELGKEKVHDS